jgi:hypothetical protein
MASRPHQRGYLQADAEASLYSQHHEWIGASNQPTFASGISRELIE